MVQLAPDWLVNKCVWKCVAASEYDRIQIAYFLEDRATGIETNVNGQISPGIIDLHALRYTNSAPFARHKFMNMLTHSKMMANHLEEGLVILQRMGKKSQTMWMSRHGQQIAIYFCCFCLPTASPSFCAFSPRNPIGGLTLLLRGAQMHIFFDCSARFQTSLRVCHKYAHYACSIHANLRT